jgi:hypothetical protein
MLLEDLHQLPERWVVDEANALEADLYEALMIV